MNRLATLIVLAVASMLGVSLPAFASPLPDPNLQVVAANAEACETTENLQQAVECAAYQVREFVASEYGAGVIPDPIHALVPAGAEGAHLHPILPCAWNESTAAYCAPLGTTLIGAKYFQDSDPYLVAAIVAHEAGHHLQATRGGMFIYAFKPSTPFETQADCVAGAFTGHSVQQGWMTSDESASLSTTFANMGDHLHGTNEQRGNAFALGLNEGLSACTALVADYRLVQ